MYGEIEICYRESHGDIIKIERGPKRAEKFKKIKRIKFFPENLSVFLKIVLGI